MTKIEIVMAKYASKRQPVKINVNYDFEGATYQPPMREAPGTSRAEASWRRMLVTQPPIQRIEVTCGSWTTNSFKVDRLNHGGLRFENLEDACKTVLDIMGESVGQDHPMWCKLMMSFEDQVGTSLLRRANKACEGQCRGKEKCACLAMLESDWTLKC